MIAQIKMVESTNLTKYEIDINDVLVKNMFGKNDIVLRNHDCFTKCTQKLYIINNALYGARYDLIFGSSLVYSGIISHDSIFPCNIKYPIPLHLLTRCIVIVVIKDVNTKLLDYNDILTLHHYESDKNTNLIVDNEVFTGAIDIVWPPYVAENDIINIIRFFDGCVGVSNNYTFYDKKYLDKKYLDKKSIIKKVGNHKIMTICHLDDLNCYNVEAEIYCNEHYNNRLYSLFSHKELHDIKIFSETLKINLPKISTNCYSFNIIHDESCDSITNLEFLTSNVINSAKINNVEIPLKKTNFGYKVIISNDELYFSLVSQYVNEFVILIECINNKYDNNVYLKYDRCLYDLSIRRKFTIEAEAYNGNKSIQITNLKNIIE